MAALGDSLTAAANLQYSPGARQEKLVISLPFPTLSLLLAVFFPICNINLLVKVGDRWKAYLIIEIVRSKAIGSICHGWQFTANAGPGMHRWGAGEAGRGALMGGMKQGLIKRVREGVLVLFLVVGCFIPWFSVKALAGGAGWCPLRHQGAADCCPLHFFSFDYRSLSAFYQPDTSTVIRGVR